MKKEEKNKKCNCSSECTCGDNCECTADNKCNDKCTCDQECHCHDKDGKKDGKLKKELETLKEENRLLNDRVLRLSAEIQNIGKRHSEEISSMTKYEGMELIKNLLPIVDNFERAIEMDKSVNEKFLEGYKMIYANLLEVLKSIGVQEIDCQDKMFDPNLMDAIMTEKVEGVDPNYVLLLLQKGYTYKDRIIRHAFVKVSE